MTNCSKVKQLDNKKRRKDDVLCECNKEFFDWTGDLMIIFCEKLNKVKYFSKKENRLLTSTEINEIGSEWR